MDFGDVMRIKYKKRVKALEKEVTQLKEEIVRLNKIVIKYENIIYRVPDPDDVEPFGGDWGF